ncbi:uncharacterized protein LOC101235185 isoform X1 [Hydra vulgaris]|uniref:uncharacterized protein LOC101235185 isoform X1 n=1 Tax=Hydra vulgaris TaxID=6087 RepID=UPI0006416664|nr:uncharacterized protein LOC101235185 [Hydra vulgaris]
MLIRSYLRETIDGIIYKNIECESEMINVINMFFGDFTEDVPINKFIISRFGVTTRSFHWEMQLREAFQDGVSIIAVDEKTNNIVGFQINTIIDLKRTSKTDVEESIYDAEKQFDLFRIINHICTDMADVNHLLLKKIPSLQRIFDSYAIGVSRVFRQKSIAFNLLKYSLKIARNVETQCATIFAANPVTEKLACKFNYLKIKSKSWNTFEVDGQKIFADYQSGSENCNNFYLDFC